MSFLIGQLLDAGLLHGGVRTVAGEGGLDRYREEPFLDGEQLVWRPGAAASLDEHILVPAAKPFSPTGGLKLLDGNLGRAVIKISAVRPDRQVIEAPAVVFHDQNEMQDAFKRDELNRDFVCRDSLRRAQRPTACPNCTS